MRIYVGNLSYRSSEQDVHKAFLAFGKVSRTQLALDPQTGRSAGFAYVEMPDEEEAQTAIARLNGKEINSRVVTVSHAAAEEPAFRPERERSDRERSDRERSDRERPDRERSGRPARSGRFARDGDDARRAAPRHPRSSSPSSSGQRPRHGGRESDAGRGPADRRPRSHSNPRGEQLRGHSNPRGDQVRSQRPRGEQARGEQVRSEHVRGGSRPASVWDQRQPSAPRRDSETSSRDVSPDRPSSDASGPQPPANPVKPPVAESPWTRRRPKSP